MTRYLSYYVFLGIYYWYRLSEVLVEREQTVGFEENLKAWSDEYNIFIWGARYLLGYQFLFISGCVHASFELRDLSPPNPMKITVLSIRSQLNFSTTIMGNGILLFRVISYTSFVFVEIAFTLAFHKFPDSKAFFMHWVVGLCFAVFLCQEQT